MSRYVYMGSFPPPHGGVTIKNALLFDGLSSYLPLEKIDLAKVKRRKLHAVISFVRELLRPSGAVIIGAAGPWRKRITKILSLVNRKKMNRSLLFVMGGAKLEDESYAVALSGYRAVYVETDSMKRDYESKGLDNVSVFPNCRRRPDTPTIPLNRTGRLSCVYFSLISEEKGALLTLDVASLLPDVDFHIYGNIDNAIESVFLRRCNELDNVTYHGVFDSEKDEVVAELSKYDVHLFPSKCPNEGVPGVLVETKMAAIPTIAFDRCFNAEIVQNGKTGYVIGDISTERIVEALGTLDSNRERLFEMKQASLESAEQFYLDSYLPSIIELMQ